MATSSTTKKRQSVDAFNGLSSHEVMLLITTALDDIDRFSPEDIALCTGALLDKLRAPAIRDTIFVDKDTGVLYLNGKPTSDEAQERFLTLAKDAKANKAADLVRALVSQKIEYATTIMVRNAATPYDLVFAKAAMWAVQQIDDVYLRLLGAARPGDSEPDNAE